MANWLKPAGGTYVPSACVIVVCQTHERTIPGKRYKTELVLDYVSALHSRRRKGKWSSPEYVRFSDPDDFWMWLHSVASTRRKTYVFTPIVSNTLTLTQFWSLIDIVGAQYSNRNDGRGSFPQLPLPVVGSPLANRCPDNSPESASPASDRRFHFSSLILTGKTDIVRYRKDGKSYQWASCRQYFEANENDLADAFKHKWMSSVFGESSSGDETHNAKDRVDLWWTVFKHLFAWWTEIDGGPFGATVGQLSYTFFRHSLRKSSVLRHSNTNASVLEESALFGGRASLFCVAPIGDPTTWTALYGDSPPITEHSPLTGELLHIDVRSMYPMILAHEKFPVRLIDYIHNPSVRTLRELLQSYGVIARVRLNCSIPEYPLRTADRVLFPIGNYTTSLAGPELLHAIDNEQIAECEHAAVYLLGTPFHSVARSLIQYRHTAQTEENYAFELFTKHLANSLSGKLAQRKYGWKAAPNVVPETDWGQWLSYDSVAGVSTVYRAIAGMTQQRIEIGDTPRNMASIYVYLTAYGRSLMRVARGQCEASVVLSQDTDGLWILSQGNAPALLERIGKATAPYAIRQNKRGQNAVFLSPSHYWVDGHWTLAGFRIVTVASEHLRVMSERTENPITKGATCPPLTVFSHRDLRVITCQERHRIVDGRGMVIPPTIKRD